jgi:phosphate transport system protein
MAVERSLNRSYPGEMRSAYGAELAALTAGLVQMSQLAEAAMSRATVALLDVDLALAEQVIGAHEEVKELSAEAEEAGLELLALQAPAARDVRTIVSSIQIVADLERMAALARHVAEITRLRHPRPVLPEGVLGYFAEMGRIAVDLADNARQVIESCDLGRARYIRESDDAMDDLHRHLFTVLKDRDWPHGTTAAVDVTLLGRYYERFADHAVEISRRVIFGATGQTTRHEPAPRYSPIRTPEVGPGVGSPGVRVHGQLAADRKRAAGGLR